MAKGKGESGGRAWINGRGMFRASGSHGRKIKFISVLLTRVQSSTVCCYARDKARNTNQRI